mgnify:CR=1 FL=1
MNHAPPSPDMPFVTLVGAGPGDPELLTLKAVKAIASATVILVDDLVHPDVLQHANPGARIIAVGKRGGCQSTPQAFIEKLMVQAALAGEQVVRLKGGDPLIFGRGGEEQAHLLAHGVGVRVINGVTAGLSAAQQLGVSLTHRQHAHGVLFITGHAAVAQSTYEPDALDWPELARTAQRNRLTLVIYMGVQTALSLQQGLLQGLVATTPVAVVQNASLPEQRELRCTLGALPARVRAAGLGSPAMLILGSVAGMDLRTVLTTDLPQDVAGHVTC